MPSQWTSLATIAAIAAIFVLDLNTPLGIAVPFLYLLVVLVAIAVRASNRQLILFGAVCTGLAASKLLVPQLPGVVEFGQSNRLIFGLLLWALLGLEFIRRAEALRQANAILQGELAERRRAEITINNYANRLQGLAGRLVEVQEVERKALAEALHDRIGQNLSTLNISLNLALAQLPEVPDNAAGPLRARLDDALGLLENTTELVRDVMEELHPALLDQYGLDVAVRWYGGAFARRTGLVFDYDATELFPRLRDRTEMALFRVVQEALTNVAKHAAASRVAVSLRRTASGIELRVADDGRGMAAELAGTANPANNSAIGSGWGLTLCQERGRAIGASLAIDSTERGTTIAVEIPNGQWER